MYEKPLRRRCGCGTQIMLIQSGPAHHAVLDVEWHPTGDVQLVRQRDGWQAQRLAGDRLARFRGRRFIEHQLTCGGPLRRQ